MVTSHSAKRRKFSIDDSSCYFIAHKLKTPLAPYGTFSSILLILNYVSHKHHKIRYNPSSIFDVTKECVKEFESVPFQKYDTLNTTGNAGKGVNEKEVLIYTTEHLLHLFATDIMFNKDYSTNLEYQIIPKSCTVGTGFLGLGEKDTWHGEPDA